MGEVLSLPTDFSKERQEVQNMLHRAIAAEARLKKDLNKIRRDLSGISPEKSLIKAQEQIRDLFLRSGSHKKAMTDLPRRKADKHRLLDEARAILKKLGPEWSLENVESYRLTDSFTAKIRELGRELDPILGKQEVAQQAHSELGSEILAAKEDLSGISSQKDPQKLKAALNQILKQGDLSAKLETIEAEVRKRQERLDLQMKGLGSQNETIGHLEAFALPTEKTIDRFEIDFNERYSQVERIEQALTEQQERLIGLDRQMDALRADGSIPKVEELDQARKHRDKGWQLVKDAWLLHKVDQQKIQSFDAEAGDLSEGYEKSVRAADQIGDRLRNESERVAKQGNLSADRKEVEKRIASLNDHLKSSKEKPAQTELEWNQLWDPIGIRPGQPKEMRTWLQGYQRLVEEASEHRAHQKEAKDLKARIETDRSLLSESLKALDEAPAGKSEKLESLLDRCDKVVADLEEIQNRRGILTSQIRDLERRRRITAQSIKQANEALKLWQKKWGEAVAHLGLNAGARPVEADAVIERTQELFERIDQAQMMEGRIRAMEADAENFSNRASDLGMGLDPGLKHLPPDEVASELNERLDKALTDAARFEELEKQYGSIEKRIQSETGVIDSSEVKLTKMCKEAGVNSYTELPEVERRSDLFRESQKKIAILERELTEYSAGASIDVFIQETKDVDYDVMPAEIEALNHQIHSLESKRSDLDQVIGSEKTVLHGMDGRAEAAELAEGAQGVLAELRDGVERYARVLVASILLRKEIERYREANQGPILKRAGEIFADLTLNSFKGLIPDFDEKDNPILMGVRPSNEKVLVDGMSDGTSDQLYLALRFASLELRFLEGEPIPLILDDILINFDDDRACATLRVLAEFSKKTQIIFFTHHRHLLELARANVSDDVLFTYSLEP
jgi:DNA repair exonuclease SbcCD ATPase subunit